MIVHRDHSGALTGRVAVVTGSSRGIGRALALAAAGADVVIAGRSEAEILTSEPRSCTGRMVTDEEILSERGWTAQELDSYWVTGQAPAYPLCFGGRSLPREVY